MPALAALMLLLLAFPPRLAAQPAADLELKQALPQEAFERLGQRQGVVFQLPEGEEWVDADAGVRVTADLRELSFWEAVLELSSQTGYEPVFEPYGRSEDGKPVLRLRRVNVKGEEGVAPAVAAGPLLIRTRDATFSVPLKLAQVRMIPMQTAVRTEVFLEPGVSAVYITAAALRAQDEAGEDLRRGEGFDPTIRIENGIGELILHFDIIKRIPKAVGRWQGLLRLVESEGTQLLRAPLTVLPEEPPAAAPPPAQAGGSAAGQPAPATRPASRDAVDFGPYRLLIQPVRVGERAPAARAAPSAAEQETSPPKRVATLRLAFPRGDMNYTDWSRLYGFLIALPPGLEVPGEATQAAERASPWSLTGYAIIADASAEDPQTAGVFRVWAQYEAAAGAPDPAWLSWELPVKSSEEKLPVVWTQPVPISGDPERSQPVTKQAVDAVPEGDSPQ